MAGSSGPDLSHAVKAVEKLMDDRIRVKRDPDQETDDVMDPVTLAVSHPDNDDSYVYQGAATYVPDMGYVDGVEGGASVQLRDGKLFIPIGAPALQHADVVEVTDSRRDPNLIGAFFTVTDTIPGTFNVSQRLQVARVVR